MPECCAFLVIEFREIMKQKILADIFSIDIEEVFIKIYIILLFYCPGSRKVSDSSIVSGLQDMDFDCSQDSPLTYLGHLPHEFCYQHCQIRSMLKNS